MSGLDDGFYRLSHRFVLIVLIALGLSVEANAAGRPVNLNTEQLTEWLVEGQISLKQKGFREKYYFSWQQTNEQFKVSLREKSMVGKVVASEAGSIFQTEFDVQTNEFIQVLRKEAVYDSLAFWLRGLPLDFDNKVSKNREGLVESIEAGQWKIQFKGHQIYNRYPFPQKITIDGDNTRLDIEILRADTNFLESWCASEFMLDDSTHYKANWINSQEFCEQLKLLHNDDLDLKMGFFGPDSMIWELNRYIMPQGFGAGRALLLQTAHPVIAAGIDDHSEVRADPLERGRRTFSFMYTMMYGSVPQALNAANDVHKIHQQVRGRIDADDATEEFKLGSEYYANELEAMIWVQAVLWDTLVVTYEQLQRKLTYEEKERFYEETKLFAMLFGIPRDKMPANWAEFERYNRYMWRRLEVSPAGKQLAEDLFDQSNPVLMVLMPIQKNFTNYNLPPRIREQYGWEEMGWFGNTFYKSARLTAKVGDRLLIPPLRYNPAYKQANARVKGKRSSRFTRYQLKMGVHQPNLVN